MELILVADDEPEWLQIIGVDLKRHGYQVLPADSGDQALDLLKSTVPALILLDIDMPGRNGLETLAEIRSRESIAHVPVIMNTSRGDREAVLQAMQAGVADYLIKSNYKPDLISTKIRAALIRASMREITPEGDGRKSIRIYQSADAVLVSIHGHLRERECLEIMRSVFNMDMLRELKGQDCILDLNHMPELASGDLEALEVYMDLFQEERVSIIAGKHFAAVEMDPKIRERAQCYISYGDFNLERL